MHPNLRNSVMRSGLVSLLLTHGTTECTPHVLSLYGIGPPQQHWKSSGKASAACLVGAASSSHHIPVRRSQRLRAPVGNGPKALEAAPAAVRSVHAVAVSSSTAQASQAPVTTAASASISATAAPATAASGPAECPLQTAFAASSAKADSPSGAEDGPDAVLQAAAVSAGREAQELDWDVMEVCMCLGWNEGVCVCEMYWRRANG